MRWLFTRYTSLATAMADTMAVAFFVDLLLSTLILAALFAWKPLGPVKWPWFVGMSLLGTLAFAIPMFVWLNWRLAPTGKASLREWWHSA